MEESIKNEFGSIENLSCEMYDAIENLLYHMDERTPVGDVKESLATLLMVARITRDVPD